jgi:hypothetical protein
MLHNEIHETVHRHEVNWPDEESFEADADTAISGVNQQV